MDEAQFCNYRYRKYTDPTGTEHTVLGAFVDSSHSRRRLFLVVDNIGRYGVFFPIDLTHEDGAHPDWDVYYQRGSSNVRIA